MRDPINPADIRVGDRVERVYVSGDHETIERFTVESVAHRAVSSCRLSWSTEAPRTGIAEWFLLDRPDPLAEVVEVAQAALLIPLPDTGPRLSREVASQIVAAIAERWELGAKNV